VGAGGLGAAGSRHVPIASSTWPVAPAFSGGAWVFSPDVTGTSQKKQTQSQKNPTTSEKKTARSRKKQTTREKKLTRSQKKQSTSQKNPTQG
jgi:hypothetical protein